jgi:hypothetical protein
VSDRLTFVDQLAFELFRLTGRHQLMQCIWVYDREVDRDGLNRFCQRLGDQPFNRLVELSPLPFGRPRWVRNDRTASVHFSADVLPRSSLLQWANQHALTPLDPINGPTWRLAHQRFSDGTSAVSMVGSHVLLDGIGSLQSIDQALAGTDPRAGFGPRQARHPVAAVIADGWQALLDLPATLMALLRLTRFGVRHLGGAWRSRSSPPPVAAPDGDQIVSLPSITALIDAELWDQRARSLGGHTYSLLAALAARIAWHMERRRPSDGSVSLLVTVNQRQGLEDDRALAIAFCKIIVDPLRAMQDLKNIGRSLKSAVRAAKETPDPILKLLPIVPWMRGAAAALVGLVFAYSDDVPVSCSNLGTLPASIGCVDGTPCTVMMTRAVDTNVTLRDLRRSHGHLVIVASRSNNKVCVSVEGYRLDAANSPEQMRTLMQSALAEFGLHGAVEC